MLYTRRFAQRIGRSASTVRRWEAEGKIQAKRLSSGHRYFDESDVRKVFGLEPEKKLTVVYCRVSSAGQKNDLKSQVAAMQTFCLGSGIAVDEWIEEIGGGMNFKRPKFLRLIDRIVHGEVNHVIIAHKDRLMRFGFDLFEHLAQENGCRITIANQETLSPQREMVEDLIAIVNTFSCRLDGMRKYQKALKEEFPEASLPTKPVS